MMYRMPDISGLFVLLALFGLLVGVVVALVYLEDKAPGLPKVLLYLGLFLWGVSLMPF
jgi:hypothetical protein